MAARPFNLYILLISIYTLKGLAPINRCHLYFQIGRNFIKKYINVCTTQYFILHFLKISLLAKKFNVARLLKIFKLFFCTLWRAYLFMFWLHRHMPAKQALNSNQSTKGYERIIGTILGGSGYFRSSLLICCKHKSQQN